MNLQTLQLLSSVSSLLGLLAILAYFYVIAQGRRAERSVRDIIQGEPLFHATQIIEILKLFNDDARRLEALSRLADSDRDNAERVLRKIKDNVDVGKLQAQSDRQRLAVVGIVGVVLLLFGVIGLLSTKTPSQPGPSPTPTPPRPSASGDASVWIVPHTNTVTISSATLKNFEDRHQIGAGTLILDGVQLKAPRRAVYVANRVEMRNGAEIVGSDFAVITGLLIGGRLTAAGAAGASSSTLGEDGGPGGQGGRFLVAAAQIRETVLNASGGAGGNGSPGRRGIDGPPGNNGEDGRCGPGVLGEFRGSSPGGDGHPGAEGGRGGRGGNGGDGGEIFLLTRAEMPPGLKVAAGPAGQGGSGGAGGNGGRGGRGGAGCNGLGGSQPTRPNGADGVPGTPGQPGATGEPGRDGRVWYKRLESFNEVVQVLRVAATTDEARDTLMDLARM